MPSMNVLKRNTGMVTRTDDGKALEISDREFDKAVGRHFTPEEIENFVKDHIQSKIDHNELGMLGLDMKNNDNFKREFAMYKTALTEGIINGIVMCGGKVEGIELE